MAIFATSARPAAPVTAAPEVVFAPTVPSRTPAPGTAPDGMVWIPGGEFSMGATAASEGVCELHGVTRDALPIHRVYVDGFWMDKTEVTNAQFARFVKETGYVTEAEHFGWSFVFYGLLRPEIAAATHASTGAAGLEMSMTTMVLVK